MKNEKNDKEEEEVLELTMTTRQGEASCLIISNENEPDIDVYKSKASPPYQAKKKKREGRTCLCGNS